MTIQPDATRTEEPIRVLELRSVWGTGGGPDKTILLGAARTDSTRVAVTVCYIRDARDPAFGITSRAASFGIDYIEIIERHSADWRVWPQLRALVRQRRIQVVHSHDYKTDILGLLLSKVESVVPLSTAHGWSGESRKDRLYYDINKRTLRRFPKVLAVSTPIKAELLRYGCQDSRVVVLPNGIDATLFVRDAKARVEMRRQLGAEPGDTLVGAVGRLETVKCYDRLISAFEVLHTRMPRSRLIIVGDGPCREDMQNQIEKAALTRSCTLLGQRTDVKELISAFDVFVQSSRSEGSPNAVLEAMALEVPVVATDVGGTLEMVAHGQHGLLVPFGDTESLVRAIESSIVDHDAALNRVKAARTRVETELSFQRRLALLDDIYAESVWAPTSKCAAGRCRGKGDPS